MVDSNDKNYHFKIFDIIRRNDLVLTDFVIVCNLLCFQDCSLFYRGDIRYLLDLADFITDLVFIFLKKEMRRPL